MIFNTINFALFFVIVLFFIKIIKQNVKLRNLILLVASYTFYGLWDWRFLVLVAIPTTIDYFCGLGIENSKSFRTRKGLLFLSIVANLSILGTFKYFDFFLESLSVLFDFLEIQSNFSTLGIIVPVGISFYTFQTMSYTIDVYQKKFSAERSVLDFALYVCFFPQLVAGPIEKARDLIPQIKRINYPSNTDIEKYLWIIFWGLFKKVVIADNIAPYTDKIFGSPNPLAIEILNASYAFTIQLFCDFSGYSEMAIGVAGLLGFRLSQNFLAPFSAISPKEYWKKHHITLGKWLRDYLYIPLGGNRGSNLLKLRNLMITMVLGGLWHGAAWNFVLWGMYHGFLLCLYEVVGFLTPEKNIGKKIFSWLLFINLLSFGFMIFRASDLSKIALMVHNLLFKTQSFFSEPMELMRFFMLFFCIILFGFGRSILEKLRLSFDSISTAGWLSGLVYGFVIVFILVVARLESDPFIYFQF